MLQGHFRLTLMVFKSHGDQHFQREICSHAVVCRRDDIALCVGKTICKDNPFHWNNFTINTRAPVIFPLSGAHTVEIFASHTKVHLAEWAGVLLRSPHCLKCSGSVQACHTSSRGASNVRVIKSSPCADFRVASVSAIIFSPWLVIG